MWAGEGHLKRGLDLAVFTCGACLMNALHQKILKCPLGGIL